MENNDIQTIEPIWTENFTAIAMSSSDEYIPYLSVCLQSLVEHTSNKHNYDIVIFSASENKYNKDLIINSYSSKNISIRFFNPQSLFAGRKLRITHDYFNEACYYRVVAPLVFKNYKKLIFTDIDLIFQTDIKFLDYIDVSNYPLAACKEPIWERYIERDINVYDINIIKYSKNVLKLKDIKTYYNTGVVVFNIEKFNKNNYVEQLLDIIDSKILLYQEQCALNYLFNGQILTLDNSWNGEVEPSLIYGFYESKKIKILHFLGRTKPWHNPNTNLAIFWWNYARRTPFYEIIMARMVSLPVQNLNNRVINAIKYRKIVMNYWKVKFLYNITFGKLKDHYRNKKQELKKKIYSAKSLR